MRRSLPALALFAAVLPPILAQQDGGQPPAVEIVPVHALVLPQPGQQPIPFGNLLHRWTEPQQFLAEWSEPRHLLGEDTLVELLDVLHGRSGVAGELSIQVRAGTAWLHGDRAEVVASARKHLLHGLALLTRPVQVEAILCAHTGEPLPTILAPEQLAATLAASPPLWRSRAICTGHGRVQLRSMLTAPYVRDVRAEVAQGSAASVPETDDLLDGVAVGIDVEALAGTDDLVLFTQFALSARVDEVAVQAGRNPKRSNIDLPVLDSAWGTASGRIPPGGALAITVGGTEATGPQRVLLLTARWQVPPVERRLGQATVLPIGALLSNDLAHAAGTPTRVVCEELYFERQGASDEGWPLMERDQLYELVRSTLGDAFDEAGGEVRYGRDHLLLIGTPEQAASVEALLVSLQERWIRNGTVLASVRPAADAASPPIHQVAIPALRSRQHVVWRGREATTVSAMNVAIAQESSMYDPMTQFVQSGLWVTGAVEGDGEQAFADLIVQVRSASPARRRGLEPAVPDDLFLVDGGIASWRHRAAPPRQPLELGNGPQGPRGGPTVVWLHCPR